MLLHHMCKHVVVAGQRCFTLFSICYYIFYLNQYIADSVRAFSYAANIRQALFTEYVNR